MTDKPAEKRGRKLLLNQKLIADLELVFSGGTTIMDACAYVGISEGSYFSWLKQAETIQARKEKKPDMALSEQEQLYLEFMRRIKKARAVMKVEAVARIRKAASDGEWQAAAWLLERTDPENWGRRVVDNRQSGEVTIKVVRK